MYVQQHETQQKHNGPVGRSGTTKRRESGSIKKTSLAPLTPRKEGAHVEPIVVRTEEVPPSILPVLSTSVGLKKHWLGQEGRRQRQSMTEKSDRFEQDEDLEGKI
ncbi:hypothetical protein E2C01_062497 [Portunus trituberculatus]|uniref:Uncharacterized protein n=1 Tax=Portunus trituberculatus TaxID=210409 RepID=A0A5B7HHG3_PORTR|nr:hypothetical protein [Portunus trituberculatus]